MHFHVKKWQREQETWKYMEEVLSLKVTPPFSQTKMLQTFRIKSLKCHEKSVQNESNNVTYGLQD